MCKERYITPDLKPYELKCADIIRTSIFELDSDDELERADGDFFKDTSIKDLFN